MDKINVIGIVCSCNRMAAAVTEMFTISGESPSLAAVRSNKSRVESHCDGCSYVRNVRDFR